MHSIANDPILQKLERLLRFALIQKPLADLRKIADLAKADPKMAPFVLRAIADLRVELDRAECELREVK